MPAMKWMEGGNNKMKQNKRGKVVNQLIHTVHFDVMIVAGKFMRRVYAALFEISV